jgi:hypothetical protein
MRFPLHLVAMLFDLFRFLIVDVAAAALSRNKAPYCPYFKACGSFASLNACATVTSWPAN